MESLQRIWVSREQHSVAIAIVVEPVSPIVTANYRWVALTKNFQSLSDEE